MKKFIITTISLLVLVAPAYAARNESSESDNRGDSQVTISGNADFHSRGLEGNGKFQFNIDPSVSPTASTTPTVTISPTITTTECDPSENWRNHGEYVSCVAHEHLGGKEVSEAAKSDIGKNHGNDEVSPTPPSGTPSASPSPITSASTTISGGISPFSNFGSIFERFFNFFKHLL